MQTFAYKNKNVSGTKVAEYEPVSSLFKALANPVRAAIVHLLSNREHTVGQLVEELGCPNRWSPSTCAYCEAPAWSPPASKGKESGTASAISTSPTSWATR